MPTSPGVGHNLPTNYYGISHTPCEGIIYTNTAPKSSTIFVRHTKRLPVFTPQYPVKRVAVPGKSWDVASYPGHPSRWHDFCWAGRGGVGAKCYQVVLNLPIWYEVGGGPGAGNLLIWQHPLINLLISLGPGLGVEGKGPRPYVIGGRVSLFCE